MKSVLGLGLLLLSTSALAAADAGASCVEVEQRLAASQRMLSTCTDNARSLSSARERCENELGDAKERSLASSAKLDACVAAKEQQCEEAAAFAKGLLEGSVRGVNGCVSGDVQASLQRLLAVWAGVAKGVAQLDDYATGVSDVLPRVVGTSELERRFAHLVRGGAPLWNRRLLIEAFKLTAPNTWQRIRGRERRHCPRPSWSKRTESTRSLRGRRGHRCRRR